MVGDRGAGGEVLLRTFRLGIWLGIAIGVGGTRLGSYLVKGSYWRYLGQIDGRSEVLSALEKGFGTVEAGMPYEALLDCTCDSVVVVRVSGVKTVRVTP